MGASNGDGEFIQNDTLHEKVPTPRVDPFLAAGLIFLVLAGAGWIFMKFFRYFDVHVTLGLVLGVVSILSGLVGAVCCFLGFGRSR